MSALLRQLLLALIIISLVLTLQCFAQEENNKPIFIVGQDVQSINDYISAFNKISTHKNLDTPDGFMAYAAINDLRGLSEPVDQGAGLNYANKTISKYPYFKAIQIGLYMRYMLKETVSGDLDKNILQLGQWIKSTKRQVYLRIGYEFDNPENEYDPQEYVQAYKYIVDKLRNMKVTNVQFVWHTIAWKAPDWPAYEPLKWYPGDQYVDWVGISFFDAAREEERNKAAQIARTLKKPLMIAESSPFKQYTDDEKLHWIETLFEYIKANNVKFLSYINVNWDALTMFKDEKWGDARLEKSPVLMSEWLEQIEKYHQE